MFDGCYVVVGLVGDDQGIDVGVEGGLVGEGKGQFYEYLF